MFWPLILPVEITACLIASVIAGVTLAAPLVKRRRLPAFLLASLFGSLAFVPSCTGIKMILDAKRFGVFTCDSFANVNDARVERYLPPTARNITLDKQDRGFRARYTISATELKSYLDDLWTRYGDQSITKRSELSVKDVVGRESHQMVYGDLGWPYLSDATEFHSPLAANGAGFSVWFSPSEQIAYERTSYW